MLDPLGLKVERAVDGEAIIEPEHPMRERSCWAHGDTVPALQAKILGIGHDQRQARYISVLRQLDGLHWTDVDASSVSFAFLGIDREKAHGSCSAPEGYQRFGAALSLPALP